MARDEEIEQILAAPLTAESMVEHLVQLAIQGGGWDNIGLVVSQFQINIAGMQTVQMSPVTTSVAAVS